MFTSAARVVDFDDEKYLECKGEHGPRGTGPFDRIACAWPQMEKQGLSVKCPRCNSTNTKFCYYNNYSLQQPYFCKTCHRYWAEGVSLRNVVVAVGRVFRKNKRSSSSASASASASTSASELDLKSTAPKRTAHTMVTSGSSASPAAYMANCISAKRESESPNARSVDGGVGTHSNSAIRINPSAQTTLFPMVQEHIKIDPHHLRGLNSAAKNNDQQGASILMINGGGGTDGITIIDSGGAVHASGNISLFTQHCPEPPQTEIFAANWEKMQCYGFGTIRIQNLGLELQNVYYVPDLGNKTIVSVSKLNELGYSVNFSQTGCSIRDERTWTHRLIGEARRVNGLFEVDYLRIPLNRAPTVSDGTSTSLWRAAWTRLNSFTKSLVQRHITPNAERLPQ